MDINHARLGTVIGNRFLLEDSVDQVPFGSAFRAVDTHHPPDALERRVMLWLLPTHAVESVASEGLRNAFARIRALRHPGIARLHELGQVEGACFITGELLDGETLRNVLDHLRPERLDADEATGILRTIGGALAYAHDCDVVHGEVRAGNVVVTMSHEAKLVNFMATRLPRLEPTAARAGGDVRGLAALAHELYTGERLGDRDKAQSKAPRRLARAIDAALHGGRHGLTVREFLASAGIDGAAPPMTAPAPRPAPEAPPLEVAVERVAPLEVAGRPDPAPRRSVWRFAVPFLAVAGLAVALHETGSVDALLAAGRQLESAGAMRLRGPDAATARDEPRPEKIAAVTDPTLAAAPAIATPPPPPHHPEPPVLSFATRKVTARESQSMVVLDIVRTSGDGPASVVWWTTDDTAHARDDYASFGKRVERLGPADNGRRIIIPIVSDSLREASEHFQVHIAARADGTRIGAIDTVDVTLLDDDDS